MLPSQPPSSQPRCHASRNGSQGGPHRSKNATSARLCFVQPTQHEVGHPDRKVHELGLQFPYSFDFFESAFVLSGETKMADSFRTEQEVKRSDLQKTLRDGQRLVDPLLHGQQIPSVRGQGSRIAGAELQPSLVGTPGSEEVPIVEEPDLS